MKTEPVFVFADCRFLLDKIGYFAYNAFVT